MGIEVYDDRLARVLELSVVIITKDEADNIAGALESVRWAEDLVVVDSGSTDRTVEIARRYTDRVLTRDWQGYGAQKNYATGLAANDWVLSLDADERVTPELVSEIRALMVSAPLRQGYRIPRTTRYLSRWMRSTDWYPDYQLRLYDRRVARWNTRYVHESVTVDGRIGTLRCELQHYAYRDLSHHLSTIDRYSTLAVKQMTSEHQHAKWLDLLGHPTLAFFRNDVLHRGFSDGVPGLIVSLMNSYYVFLKFAKLWAYEHADTAPSDHR